MDLNTKFEAKERFRSIKAKKMLLELNSGERIDINTHGTQKPDTETKTLQKAIKAECCQELDGEIRWEKPYFRLCKMVWR